MSALHPFVDQILSALVVSADGKRAEMTEKARHEAEKRLRGDLREDMEAFLHLAKVWSDMHAQHVEPAAEQILRLLEILPDIQDADASVPAAERAQKWLGNMQGAKAVDSGLSGKTTLGSVGLRKKS